MGGWLPCLYLGKKLKRTKEAIKDWVKNSPSSPREEVERCKK
jgi:hypothetical protein